MFHNQIPRITKMEARMIKNKTKLLKKRLISQLIKATKIKRRSLKMQGSLWKSQTRKMPKITIKRNLNLTIKIQSQ
jgi:hypothetical protein